MFRRRARSRGCCLLQMLMIPMLFRRRGGMRGPAPRGRVGGRTMPRTQAGRGRRWL